MRLLNFFRRTEKHFAIILILAVLLPTVYFSSPKQVEAGGWPVWTIISDFLKGLTMPSEFGTGVSTAATAGASIANTVLSAADHLKKFLLDPLAMMLAKIIIQDITAATVKWINSGFNGNPAFVQNPEQFFLTVGDQTAATYLSTSNSHFIQDICTPFSAKIRLALVQSYLSTKTPNKCTIQSIITNWTNFGTNFYDNGGWDGWFSMTQNDSNNPLGVYLQEKDSLNSSIGSRINHYSQQLNQGQGFLSWETCKKGATQIYTGVSPGTCSDGKTQDAAACSANGGTWIAADNANLGPMNCADADKQVNTPGSVIATQLGITLGSPLQQLGVAQSINQIVGALMTQMIKSVVGGFGTGGLSGLSQSSAATQSLQAQLQANATSTSPQFQAVQSQITSTESDTMNQSTTDTSGLIPPATASAPSITLQGNGNCSVGSSCPDGSDPNNPMIWTLGVAWVDPGFIAIDTSTGTSIPVCQTGQSADCVVVGGAPTGLVSGTYTITYDVTYQGVAAPTVTRTVVIPAPTTTQ